MTRCGVWLIAVRPGPLVKEADRASSVAAIDAGSTVHLARRRLVCWTNVSWARTDDDQHVPRLPVC
ncbi:hypothetical protein [Streptomyces corynorhini]|uniref:Uncharacterized protein n=1 Tax=Streptomyces corynorhini TaxID=2282652 RepID=A0A370BBN6_9ACTN|nr:hypothetical protein [Streptomyces corynorhini]RDG38062.1 hypothetical protein DVH02_11065 [Streptomyces corynorhini]